MNRWLTPVVALLGFTLFTLSACASSESPVADDDIAPTLEITGPERGTHAPGDVVEVTGRLHDSESGPATVTINDVPADVDDDGSFRAMVPVATGITILRTVGADAAGNEARESRAVLAGLLAPQGTQIKDAIVATLSPPAFDAIGTIASQVVAGVDFEAVGEEVSPIVDRGNSCFGVEVDLRDVNFSDLDIGLVPVNGGLDIEVTISDLDVDMRANYEVSCFGGGAGVNIEASRLTIAGSLGVSLTSGRFVVNLDSSTAQFEGFDLDVGSIPDSIVNFFVDDIDLKVATAILGPINSLVPPLLESQLGEMAQSTVSATIVGTELTLEFEPTRIELTSAGGEISMDFQSGAPSLSGTTYLATPQLPGENEPSGAGLDLAIADDVANQLLALLWHDGALEAGLDATTGPLAGLIEGAERIELEMMLPPVVTTSAESALARIGIGDLIVAATDQSGQPLARLALSGHIEVEIKLVADGVPTLVATVSDISVDVLDDPDALGLSPEQIATLAEAAIATLRTRLNEPLRHLQIPRFGADVRSPTLGATRGYLLVSSQLSADQ